MPLDSGGRVLLKIWNKEGELLVSRPCLTRDHANIHLNKFLAENNHGMMAIANGDIKVEVSEMVPRI